MFLVKRQEKFIIRNYILVLKNFPNKPVFKNATKIIFLVKIIKKISGYNFNYFLKIICIFFEKFSYYNVKKSNFFFKIKSNANKNKADFFSFFQIIYFFKKNKNYYCSIIKSIYLASMKNCKIILEKCTEGIKKSLEYSKTIFFYNKNFAIYFQIESKKLECGQNFSKNYHAHEYYYEKNLGDFLLKAQLHKHSGLLVPLVVSGTELIFKIDVNLNFVFSKAFEGILFRMNLSLKRFLDAIVFEIKISIYSIYEWIVEKNYSKCKGRLLFLNCGHSIISLYLYTFFLKFSVHKIKKPYVPKCPFCFQAGKNILKIIKIYQNF